MRLLKVEKENIRCDLVHGREAMESFKHRVSKKLMCEASDLAIIADLFGMAIQVYDSAGLSLTMQPLSTTLRRPLMIEHCATCDGAGEHREHYMLLANAGDHKITSNLPIGEISDLPIDRQDLPAPALHPPEAPNPDELPTTGLIVLQPYLDLLLTGTKTWEIRSTNTETRGEICLVLKGRVYGTISITGCQAISHAELELNRDKHQIKDISVVAGYTTLFAWMMSSPKKLPQPLPFAWKTGQQVWVKVVLPKVPELELDLAVRKAESDQDLDALDLKLTGFQIACQKRANSSSWYTLRKKAGVESVSEF